MVSLFTFSRNVIKSKKYFIKPAHKRLTFHFKKFSNNDLNKNQTTPQATKYNLLQFNELNKIAKNIFEC